MEGIICQKRLWLQANRPTEATPSSVAEEHIKAEGTRVGIKAREMLFPTGALITEIGMAALAPTQVALATQPPAIFEATFCYDDILVMCDILVNNGDGSWDLIEVKASTRLKSETIHDVAIQTYVLRGAGINLRRQRVMLINNSETIRPDHTNLYVDRDVTHQITDTLVEVQRRRADFRDLIAQPDEPSVSIGNHCQKPHCCPFKTYCWQDVPEPSIFSIPRLKGQIKTELAAQGILHLADLPEGFPLAAKQQSAVELMLYKREEIDREALRRQLQTLAYPIYFLDFETDASAIPCHSSLKPYEQIPFQYSCHIRTADGQLSHREYLHTDQSDPRHPLLENLLMDIGPVGSVVVYNAPFERGVLRKLAELFPSYADPLQSIIDRLWDQLDVFKHHYQSYRFGGSNSIKKVLPVVAPHLSYSELAVNRGDQAQAVWNRMIELPDSSEKRKLIADLLAYCKLDTLAMVEIQRHLEETCSRAMVIA